MPKSQRSSSNWSILRQRACGSSPPGAKRQLVLSLEHLENRCLMNADPAPVSAVSTTSPDGDDSAALAIADVAFDDVYRLPSHWGAYTFESPPEGPEFDRIDDLPAWLVAEADHRFGELFGTDVEWRVYEPIRIVPFEATDLTVIGSGVALDRAASFSTTNTQVAGVDEADLVETDGEHLYMIAGDELLIIDVRDAGSPTIASRVQLESRPTGMYLAGDRLTLIHSSGGGWHNFSAGLIRPANFVLGNLWSGPYQPAPVSTEVKVLDIADRTAPTLVQSTEFDGQLVSSRMVEGQLRIVVQQNIGWSRLLPPIKRYSVGFDEVTQQHQLRYETRNEYLGRVYEQLKEFSLPGYRTLDIDGEVIEQQSFVELDELSRPLAKGHTYATTVATVDTLSNDAGPAATETVFTGNAATIYASQDSLYVFGTAPTFGGGGLSIWGYPSRTAIWKFDFGETDHSVELSARGFVDGRLPDQFAADEHDGYLRVVTTGRTWSAGQELFVLKQVGKQLKTVGQISDIAPNENLHSVRFLGDEAFVVTFRKVDPLFAIDLSDPTNPFIAGELKIPGFSDYLQPLGEDHLLGVGRGADENLGRFQELQVSIFDVTDLDDPQLAYRYSFGGGRSTNSEALWEHHAVSYFPESEILAIPIYSTSQRGGFRFGVDNSPILGAGESALQVFQIDVATGFEPLSTITHDSRIVRSLRIGEQLVVVSSDYVTIHTLAEPDIQLGKLELNVGTDSNLVELTPYVGPESLTGLELPTDDTGSPRTDTDDATPRRAFVPTERARYAAVRSPYAPASTMSFAASDAAAERLRFALPEQLAEQLASALVSEFDDRT